MRTILLTGKNGQVGWELQRTLQPLGKVVAVDVEQLDLTDLDAIRRMVRDVAPDIVVNPAAYTNVDKAESEPELAHAVNAIAPGVLAEEAKRLGAWMVHYSTDYVFDGNKQGAYLETDETDPVNVYGKTKLSGEKAVQAAGGRHLILRTSWVYGARGRNFLLTMLRLARERSELQIVDDQVGAPAWSRALAEITAQTVVLLMASPKMQDEEGLSGIYHLTSSGSVSWHGFAKEILRLSDIGPLPELLPISSENYPSVARRPRNSMLSSSKFRDKFGLELGRWEDGLQLCMEQLKEQDQ